MDEIVWSGWLQKKGGDSTGFAKGLSFMGVSGNKERYFVLKRKSIVYYAPPQQVSRGSIFIESPTPKALTDLGFVKKGSIDLDEVLSMKKAEDKSLQLITTTGRTYEVLGFEDAASSLDLASFEGCLLNLGIKMEADNWSSIYEGKEKDTFEGSAGLSAADLASAERSGKGGLKPGATTAANAAKATAAAAAVVPLPTAATAAAAAAAAAVAAPTTPKPAAPLTGKDLLKRPASHQAHADDHMSDLVTNRERTIDEMKIQTMYKMVEDVEIVADGRNLEKKVLYLTNKQCNMFDDVGILRCLQALDLGKPKCVIRLLAAEKGVAQYSVHTETRGYVLSAQQYGCDLDPHDAARSQTQLDLFMKTSILPLAKQTHALIICSGVNDDALAASLERVVVPEQARLGKNCPFKVLTFVWSFEVHYKAYCGEGIAGKVAAECTAWGIRLDALSQFMADYPDKQLQRCDMIQSASHVIVFETFEDGKTQMGPSKTFQAKLMDAMTHQLPSMAIQIYACEYNQVSDLSRRGIPILFLDSRERAITTRVNTAGTARTLVSHLARCSDAFPTILAEHLSQFPKNPDGTVTLIAKRSLLHLAFRMILSGIDALGDQCIVDYDNSSAVAMVHAALLFGIDSTDADGAQVPLYVRIQELKRAEMDAGSNSGKALIPTELVREAAHFLNARLRTNVTRAKLQQVRKWQQDNPPGSKLDHNRGLAGQWEVYLQKNLTFAENNNGEYILDTDQVSYLNILDILSSQLTFSGSLFDLDEVNRTISSVVKIDRLPKNNSLEALVSLQDAWDHVDAYHNNADFYKVLTKLSYALLLLAGIATSIIAISRERVDSSDSETENSSNTSSQYAILAISLLVTTVVGYVNFMNPAQRWQQLRGAAMNMESEIWMFRTRAGDYRGPQDGSDVAFADNLLQERIQQIKDAVLEGADMKTSSFFGMFASPNLHQQHAPNYRQLKANRTTRLALACCQRTAAESDADADTKAASTAGAANGSGAIVAGAGAGAGAGANVAPGGAYNGVPMNLGTEDDDGQSSPVVQMASATGTSIDELLSFLGTRFVKPKGETGPKDNHYLPVLPANYVTFRIERALKFYKKRIPLCNRTRHVGQLLSTIGSLAGVVLSFLNKIPYTVITAIGVTGVMAWLEFQGTNNKIERYSSVVDALQKHIMWWKTRPPIEKSATENIDRLVCTCEGILRDEMNAWRSSSAQQSKMLEKSASDGASGAEV